VSHGYFYGAEKLVLLTVYFTPFGKLVSPTVIFYAKNIHPNDSCLYKFGKLVSPTVNFTYFGKLVSVKAIPICLSPTKLVSVAGVLGNKIKN
jgi:hypothetical protein